MTEALLVSNLLLCVLVIALAAVVLALMRQIGVLHERVAPAGALVVRGGPAVGEAAPVLEVEDWSGRALRIGGADAEGRTTLHQRGGEAEHLGEEVGDHGAGHAKDVANLGIGGVAEARVGDGPGGKARRDGGSERKPGQADEGAEVALHPLAKATALGDGEDG